MEQKILVVEDESDLQEIIMFNLRSEGYHVLTVSSAEEAMNLDLGTFDLFLFDVMMGGISGFKLADIIRSELKLETPIIFVTAKDAENDLLTGFSLGADDYIRKPFSIVELKARVKAVLGRSKTSESASLISIGPVTMDLARKEVKLNDRVIDLTRKEYQILKILIDNRDRFVPREIILESVWSDTYVSERTVDVHVARLRKRLGDFGSNIKSKSGYGYHIVADNK